MSTYHFGHEVSVLGSAVDFHLVLFDLDQPLHDDFAHEDGILGALAERTQLLEGLFLKGLFSCGVLLRCVGDG